MSQEHVHGLVPLEVTCGGGIEEYLEGASLP